MGVAHACSQPQTAPEYDVTATIKDLMISTIDPASAVVFDSTATVITETGVEHRAPQTDEEWAAIRRSTITMMEAANLLQMPGRRIAGDEEKSANPRIELEPGEIQALIDRDRKTWEQLARKLHAAGKQVLRAIESRNTEALLDVGADVEEACESCHRRYWYPSQTIPAARPEVPSIP